MPFRGVGCRKWNTSTHGGHDNVCLVDRRCFGKKWWVAYGLTHADSAGIYKALPQLASSGGRAADACKRQEMVLPCRSRHLLSFSVGMAGREYAQNVRFRTGQPLCAMRGGISVISTTAASGEV